jgi:hypothetical protein
MDIFFIELLVHIYYHGFPFLTSKGIFLKKKLKTRALSYYSRRTSNYTSRAEANATTHKQRTQQDTVPPQPGRRAKRKPLELAPSSPTLCHDQSRTPLQAQAAT